MTVRKKGKPKEWFGPVEAAAYLFVHPNTIKRIPPEELPYARVGSRGDRRYSRIDLQNYMERRMVRERTSA